MDTNQEGVNNSEQEDSNAYDAPVGRTLAVEVSPSSPEKVELQTYTPLSPAKVTMADEPTKPPDTQGKDVKKLQSSRSRLGMYLEEVVDPQCHLEAQKLEQQKALDLRRPQMRATFKWIRRKCRKIVLTDKFENVMFLIILANSIYMVMDLEYNLQGTGTTIGYVFTSIFFVEMVVKVTALGWSGHHQSYWVDGWNKLDFIVLIFSIVGVLFDLFWTSNKMGVLLVLRMVRLMRALRTFGRVNSMRVVVGVIFRAIHQLVRVSFLFNVIMIIFSCLGVQFFRGALRGKCVVEDFLPIGYESLSRDQLFDTLGSTWELWLSWEEDAKCGQCSAGYTCAELLNPNHDFLSFDSFGFSLLTCFTVVTGEGWAAAMYDVVHQTSSLAVLFFLFLVCMGGYLCLNMLLAAIRQVFSAAVTNQLKLAAEQKTKMIQQKLFDNMKRSQKRAVKENRSLSEKLAKQAGTAKSHTARAFNAFLKLGPVRTVVVLCRTLVSTQTFSVVSMLATVINTITLAIMHHNMDKTLNDNLSFVNLILSIWFWMESGLKIIAFHKAFHKDMFDMFDLFVNVSTVLASQNVGNGSLTALRSIRQLKVLRVVRAAKYSDALSSALKVINSSMYLLSSLLCMLWGVILLYGVIGMILFKDHYVSYDDQVRDSGMASREDFSFAMAGCSPYVSNSTRCEDTLRRNSVTNEQDIAKVLQACALLEADPIEVWEQEYRTPLCMDTIWESQEHGGERLKEPSESLDTPRNGFRTFYWSCITLFEALTLEGWTALMYDAMSFNAFGGAVFYTSFVFIGVYFMLSLMISIILDNFEREYREELKKQSLNKKRGKKQSLVHPALTSPSSGGRPDSPECNDLKFSEVGLLLKSIEAEQDQAVLEEIKQELKVEDPDSFVDITKLVELLEGRAIISSEISESILELYTMWVFYDKDNSGELEVREVLNLLETLSTQLHDDEKAQILVADLQFQFHEYQGDNVQFYEFLELFFRLQSDPEQGSLVKMLKPEQVHWLSEKFKECDYDQSGYISTIEFKDFLNSVGVHINDWEMQIMVMEMDSDGDNHICFTEFLRGILHYFGDLGGGDALASEQFKDNIDILRQGGDPALVKNTSNRSLRDEHTKDPEKQSEPADKAAQTEQADQPESEEGKNQLDLLVKKKSKWATALAFSTNVSSASPQDIPQDDESDQELENPSFFARGQTLLDRISAEMEVGKKTVYGRSFFIFGVDNPIRCWVKSKVVETWYFQWTIFICILSSCVVMGFEDPNWDSKPTRFQILESIFLSIFVVEALLKMLVYGVFIGPGTYMKDGWNVLDIVVVMSSCISFLMEQSSSFGGGLSWLKSIRLVRALRPLRAVAQRRGGRSSLTALMLAMPSFITVFFMSVMIQLLFSIVAVDLFAGGFYHCVKGGFYSYDTLAQFNSTQYFQSFDGRSPLANYKEELVKEQLCWQAGHTNIAGVGCWDATSPWSSTKQDGLLDMWIPLEDAPEYLSEESCVAAHHRWVDRIINFNNVLESMLACFTVMTGEGWVELMIMSVDIGDTAPSEDRILTKNINIQENKNESHAIFFVAYIHVFAFFILDLYAGAVYSFYQQVKLQEEGKSGMTASQQQWWDMHKLLAKQLKSMPRPRAKDQLGQRSSRWWHWLRAVRESTTFAAINLAVLIACTLIAMIRNQDEPKIYKTIAYTADQVIIVWFTIELCIKMSFLGYQEFLNNPWNRSDCFIWLIVLVEVILREVGMSEHMAVYAGLYILRLVRFGHLLGQLGYGRSADSHMQSLRFMILQYIERAQVIFESFIESLSALVDLAMLVFVLYYIFAIIAMNIFGTLPTDKLNNYNDDANFSGIIPALLTLFRASTGEDWQALYIDMVWLACDADKRMHHPENCPKLSTFAFFSCFYMVIVVMIVSIVITVIIDIFQEIVEREFSALGMAHIKVWMHEWKKVCRFDASGDSYLTVQEFKEFLTTTEQPLGVGSEATEEMVLERIKSLTLNVHRGKVYLKDALFAVAHRVACISNPCIGPMKNATSDFLVVSYGNAFLARNSSIEVPELGTIVESVKSPQSSQKALDTLDVKSGSTVETSMESVDANKQEEDAPNVRRSIPELPAIQGSVKSPGLGIGAPMATPNNGLSTESPPPPPLGGDSSPPIADTE